MIEPVERLYRVHYLHQHVRVVTPSHVWQTHPCVAEVERDGRYEILVGKRGWNVVHPYRNTASQVDDRKHRVETNQQEHRPFHLRMPHGLW